MTDLGRRVLGLAAIALGLVGLAFGDFAAVWQPAPGTPFDKTLAYVTAAVEVAAGLALQWRRTARWAGLVLGAIALVFALLWVRRVVGAPQLFATWLGVAEQLAIALGALVAYSGPKVLGRFAQTGFGICLLAFGAAHFIYVKETAVLVPAWLPPGQDAWAYITGACDIAAGVALITGLQARLAAYLTTAMFAVFGVLVWAPQLADKPGDHMTWAGNAINLALVGAAWVVADAAARRARSG